ncbi:MAG: aldo/keto reductase [Treponema sp. GWB1_62_6]|nr:MAG: aldo/keto reductase [Treponema sp. GWC1_61_84]OHE70257.1 MAG: aldo/keto reductase [Treponema sp. GWB1_62_6]
MSDQRKRTLGKTGFIISEVGLGTWQVGGKWGEPFDDKSAEEILNKAIDSGINFIDTADVYGSGMSEAAVGRVVRKRTERVYVATKCGRQISPHVAAGYTPERLRGFVEASLKNSGLPVLDLVQLHCPPTEVYYRQELFETFDRLKEEGKILNLGVSVEKVEEALKAIEYPNVATVQIIFNMFRHRPSELFFEQAKKRNIGVIVRVPLASGLLTGKFSGTTAFGPADHRAFNRNGEAFDKGETFSGVPYEIGLQAVARLKEIFPAEPELALWAIRWILMFPEVSTVIPGASRLSQLDSNCRASSLRDLTGAEMEAVAGLYREKIAPAVHQLW